MGKKLGARDASAYESLDRLLFREWDPIGVYAMDGPDEEYQGYLPEFWRLVREGAPAEDVAGYLGKIEAECMGMDPTTSLEHRLDVARKAAALVNTWLMPVRP